MIYTIEKCPYCGTVQIRTLKTKENMEIKWHECVNCKKKYRLFSKKESRVLELSEDLFYIVDKYKEIVKDSNVSVPSYKIIFVDCPNCKTKSQKLIHISALKKEYIVLKCPNCGKKFYAKTKNKSRIDLL